MEDRLKASILVVGGLRTGTTPRPEADEFNYVTHVRIPTLMMNGKYDMVFPPEVSVRPMFELLGTPREHKRLVLWDTDHGIVRKEYIKETLAWLDRYLGLVK